MPLLPKLNVFDPMRKESHEEKFGYTANISNKVLSPRVANMATFKKFYKDYKSNKVKN